MWVRAAADLFRDYPDHHFYWYSLTTTGEAHAPCPSAWSTQAGSSAASAGGKRMIMSRQNRPHGRGFPGNTGKVIDTLRLEVAETLHPSFHFQVKVYVNEVDLTEASGSGMDPFELLVPVNRLAVGPQPHLVQFACCGACGRHECWPAEAVIRRDGGLVHWSMSGRDIPEAATFAAGAYEAEISRAGADHSWETPARTVWRLVLTHLAGQPPLPEGMVVTGMVTRRATNVLAITLEILDEYQIFIDFPWGSSDPAEMADEVCATFARPPEQWTASWWAVKWDNRERPPAIAGPSWHFENIPS